ncbi:MAG: RNA-binding protein [Planctomycetota bacterium]|nr:RNA-binding protein [Planctomycetota bacterium]
MGTKLFVGNLSYSSTEDILQELFSADGRQVDQVNIVTDRETGRSRGFAFVEMGSQEDADAAKKALDGHDLDGRPLRVDEAHERGPRPGH